MIFNAKEIEEITGGKWENLTQNISFSGINFNLKDTSSDDIFVTRSGIQFSEVKKGNEDKIHILEQKGVAGIIVRDEAKIDTKLPKLVVKNTKDALKKIALATSKKTNTKKVLVTGSYGKTGFKVRLNHLIKEKIKTKILSNSSNRDSGVYKALSIIDKDDKLAIIEVSGSSYTGILRSSKDIQPDICVITSIGHENIHIFKTIDNIIKVKSSVVQHLKKDGVCIIHKDKYYNKLSKNILYHNPYTIIKTIGNSSDCDAYIIKKEFYGFGWKVEASIEDEIVKYYIPIIDEHIAISSLLELLTAKLLKVDLQEISKNYQSIEHYYSSGKLYKVSIDDKNFFLYDQSKRGGIESYESLLKSIKYIKPKNNGKKILLTSEFVDYEDDEMKNIECEKFQNLFYESGLDMVFSIEKFSEHMDVLHDKNIWELNSFTLDDIQKQVIDKIQNDDVLFVKAIFESKMYKFLDYLKKQPNCIIKDYKESNMEDEEVEKHEIIKLLDKAGYSSVFLAKNKLTGQTVALKKIEQSRYIRLIENEISFLNIMNKYNGIKFLNAFKTEQNIYIELSYAKDGNLKKYVEKNGVLDNNSTDSFLSKMVASLKLMRDKKILHLDLKPANILLSENEFTLSDWGNAHFGKISETIHLKGNPIYIAPEFYYGSRDIRSEIYALGCSLYFILTGKHIYNLKIRSELVEKIYATLYFNANLSNIKSKKFQYLISKMLEKNPQNRITLDDLEDEIKKDEDTFKSFDYKYTENETIDFSDSFKINKKIADDEVPYLQNECGREYIDMGDFENAYLMFEKAANHGYANAKLNLALMHYNKKYNMIDYEKAYKLIEESAKGEYDKAQYYMGMFYEEGLYIEKNISEAIAWYIKSAKKWLQKSL